jgi:predicted MFS family arabinose efflux permease
VLAGLCIGYLASRLGRRTVLVGAVASLPVALLLYALAPGLWLGAVAILLVGACYLVQFSSLGAVVQLRSPRALRGRVTSLYMLVLGTTYPIGLAVQGWIGDQVGLRRTTGGAAVLLGLVVVAVAVGRPTLVHRWDDPLADAGAGGGPAGGVDADAVVADATAARAGVEGDVVGSQGPRSAGDGP